MPKLLNLILYSENSPQYIEMYKILSSYLKLNNIDHYFYAYKSDLESDYEIIDDIIYIKGEKETIVPGCLDKTIKVFNICKNFDYQYIVRSNISTVIDFKKFSELLGKIKTDFDYGGAGEGYHENIHFASGCCLILSKKAVNFLLSNKETLEYTLTDDVAIAKVFTNFYITSFRQYRVDNVSKEQDGIIFYRNKQLDGNRDLDVVNMKNIVSKI